MKHVKFHLHGETISVWVRSDEVVSRLSEDLSRIWVDDRRGLVTIDWEDGHQPTYINIAHLQMVETEVLP